MIFASCSTVLNQYNRFPIFFFWSFEDLFFRGELKYKAHSHLRGSGGSDELRQHYVLTDLSEREEWKITTSYLELCSNNS